MKPTTKPLCEIRYKDFTFTPSTNARDRFDLLRDTEVINKKTKKKSISKKPIGYGYKFDEALDQMIKEGLSERSDISDIKAYVTEYKKAVEEVKSILK
jgi:hypothetical protein